MAVSIKSNSNIGMPQVLADYLHIYPCCQHDGGVGMAQVM
jgi:hypothetical protein